MLSKSLITPAAAVLAANFSDRIPGVSRLGSTGKIAAGAVIVYASPKFVPEGVLRMAAVGVGVGLAVEGILDVALGQA